jgi:hypothetical protein
LLIRILSFSFVALDYPTRRVEVDDDQNIDLNTLANLVVEASGGVVSPDEALKVTGIGVDKDPRSHSTSRACSPSSTTANAHPSSSSSSSSSRDRKSTLNDGRGGSPKDERNENKGASGGRGSEQVWLMLPDGNLVLASVDDIAQYPGSLQVQEIDGGDVLAPPP